MSVCQNCQSSVDSAFCPTCGQEQIDGIPRVRDWLREVLDELLFVEGKLPISLLMLARKPGMLSREWKVGRRLRYVRPFRLYLLTAAVLVLVGAALGYLDGEVFLFGSEQQTPVGDLLAFYLLVVAVPSLAACTRLFAGFGRSEASFMPFIIFSLHTHAAFLVLGALAMGIHFFLEPVHGSAQLVVFSLTAMVAGFHFILALRRFLRLGWVRASITGVSSLLAYVVLLQLLAGVAAIAFFALPGH